jgi:hypothetical protein
MVDLLRTVRLENFQNYNQEQLLFAQNEAEYVAGEVYNKFGE